MVSLSVITVCLNDGTGIKKTAESISTQTDSDFEWVVVDGGSTDGTCDYLRNVSAVSTLISEQDTGIYNAMNKGIGAASGDYLLFLNAGDTLAAPDVIQKVRPSLMTSLVIGQLKVHYPDNPEKDFVKDFAKQDIRAKYLFYRSLPHPSTFIDARLFKKFGLYDESFRIAGDHDFFARVLMGGAEKLFIPFCISEFVMDGMSTMMKNSTLLHQEMQKIRQNNFSPLYRMMRFTLGGLN